MILRAALACLVIVALSGAVTATLVLNEASKLAKEIFPKDNQISAPKSVVNEEYSGGPQTYLILGSDRRAQSKDAEDRLDPPHSDTILLVRFDPEQNQTSVLSIPRDLMVTITTHSGQIYEHEKINAAYTIGNKLGGVRGGMLLAAETIEHEVFPGLKLNGIVDVSFAGFIRVVDALGCAYVNVDHRYLHYNNGTPEENYSEINLQPGYQKLCYENALAYVRYRHNDSDFVRVARQQDFIRDLREQVSPSDVVGQIDTIAKAVGHAIISTFHGSTSELLQLAELIGFSQGKPLRQVPFQKGNVNYRLGETSFVTSTSQLEQATLTEFLHGHQQVNLPSSQTHHSSHSHHHSHAVSAAALGLYPSASSGQSEAVRAAVSVPFTVLYPAYQTGPAVLQQVHPYILEDTQKHRHHAYVIDWQQNIEGGYYDFEGTDWTNPPLFAHARTQTIDGHEYMLIDDGEHIHVIGWRQGAVLYWLTNTLLEELSNQQMIAIARSAAPPH